MVRIFTKLFLLLILSLSFSFNAFSQLWKQYQDSALAYSKKRDAAKTIAFFLKEKEALKKDSIKTATYAQLTEALATFYQQMNQFDKSMAFYEEAMKTYKNLPNDLFYAQCCLNMGVLCRKLTQYDKSEKLQLEALRVYGIVSGKGSEDYAQAVYNIGHFYHVIGKFDLAEKYYLESMEIRGGINRASLKYSQSLNGLANFYSDKSDFEKAEKYYLEAMQITILTSGTKGKEYATICGNLGIFYKDLRQYEKSEQLLKEALALNENLVGKSDPAYGAYCNSLGNLYKDENDPEKAIPYYNQAIQIWKTAGEGYVAEYAQGCNNLANTYCATGEYEKAELLVMEALRIRERIFGKDHPDYAQSCNSLSAVYSNMGNFDKAEPFIITARNVWGKSLGRENPQYITSTKNLAMLNWGKGQTAKAFEYFKEAIDLQFNQIKSVFQFATEREKKSFLLNIGNLIDKFYSFSLSVNSKEVRQKAYNVALAYRNLVLDASVQLRKAIYDSPDTAARNNYERWINKREEIGYWLAKPTSERPSYLKDLEDQSAKIEKELSRLSESFRNQSNAMSVTWTTIQQHLKKGEAAIEFDDLNYWTVKGSTDSIFYIALIIRKDRDAPEIVRLFEKKDLDFLLNVNSSKGVQDYVNRLYARSNSYELFPLYKLVWRPMEVALKGIQKVYISPSAGLHQLAFSAIPVNQDECLSDKYNLVQLNSTRALENANALTITPADKIRLYGGIKYDTTRSTQKEIFSTASATGMAGNNSSLDRGNETWPSLPATEVEINSIEAAGKRKGFSIEVFKGLDASEESFKSLTGNTSPALIHVATHGFFYGNPKKTKTSSFLSGFGGGQVFRQSSDPLLRSGLLFAGANIAWKNKAMSKREDGILTAYEVSDTYLPNTKLVVLSACETALGEIEGMEVYGMQRAFAVAGVQNMVMSLWKVDDAATAEFMQEFYKNIFNGQSIADGFYNAQKLEKNKYRDQPYKWAAWILVR